MKKISKTITFRTTLVALSVLVFSTPMASADFEPIQFPSERQVANTQLELQGVGIKRVVFIKAFVAGFYFDKSARLENPLDDVAKQIEVQYFVDIPGKKLNAFTIDSMNDNITRKEFENIQEEVALMEKYFVDLSPGDKFSLLYIPGEGTRFIYNGELIGTIKGAEFAKALFSTWVGKKPFDASMKKKILNMDKEEISDDLALYLRYNKGEI